jgi:two-component system cell cycle response regulator DivK
VGQKILVVEDNELNLKLFCDLLRAHGYQAEPVRDGREAVDRARAFAPDLVVMDIQMPYVSGLELIEQLKGDPELSRMPIMAVTAYAAKGDEERIREAGAEGYVSKPISVMRFVEAVRALLAAPRTEEPPGSEARTTRRFAQNAERVFDAWLDERTLGEWLFALPDSDRVEVSIDARPGGRYEIVEWRDEDEIRHTGAYEQIERPIRLSFSLDNPIYSPGPERISIVITPSGDGCDLVLVQSVSAGSSGGTEPIERGWTAMLESLAGRLQREGEEG